MRLADTSTMADPDYQAVRHRDWGKVMGNRVTPARLWNKACHAYNVHLEPTREARDGLSRAQAALAAVDPGLLVCPPDTLHISVAWLLAVHVDYEEPKSVLWQRHGEEWTRELARIVAGLAPFTLRYRWLVATESAVIAVAEPAEPVQRLRDAIRGALVLPGQTNNTARLVHSTLFRYRSALADPARLLAAVDATGIDLPTAVDQLTVSEELVYPSLVTSEMARLPLRGTGGAG
jgi:hypothetical protein